MNKRKLKEIATSLTTLVFLVIGISGVMLYFHLFSSSVKELHEILGLAFVVVAILHIYVNWNSMKSYFNKSTFMVSTIIVLVISSFFVMTNSTQQINPKTMILQSVLTASIEDSFKLLKIDYNKAEEILNQKNIKLKEYNSIDELAKKNKTSPFEMIVILSSKD